MYFLTPLASIRFSMRNRILATLTIIAMAIVFTSYAQVAEASGDNINTATCNLSKNWKVTFTAQWLRRTKNNYKGFLNYVIVDSPSKLKQVAIDVNTDSKATSFQIRDNKPDSSGIERYPTQQASTIDVVFKVTAPSGAICQTFLFPDITHIRTRPPQI